jgi:hypothetical protein
MSENTATPVVSVSTDKVVSALMGGADRIVSGYDGLTVKARNAVKRALSDGLSVALENGDLSTAIAANVALKATAPVAAEKVEVDPKVAVAHRVAILNAVANHLMSEFSVSTDMVGSVTLSDDDVAKGVSKFGTVTTSRAPRTNDIGALIADVFADVAPGTFLKVSEIRNAIATANPDLGVTAQWDGRINAALFPKNKEGAVVATRVDGIEAVAPGHAAYVNRNGAVRV